MITPNIRQPENQNGAATARRQTKMVWLIRLYWLVATSASRQRIFGYRLGNRGSLKIVERPFRLPFENVASRVCAAGTHAESGWEGAKPRAWQSHTLLVLFTSRQPEKIRAMGQAFCYPCKQANAVSGCLWRIGENRAIHHFRLPQPRTIALHPQPFAPAH